MSQALQKIQKPQVNFNVPDDKQILNTKKKWSPSEDNRETLNTEQNSNNSISIDTDKSLNDLSEQMSIEIPIQTMQSIQSIEQKFPSNIKRTLKKQNTLTFMDQGKSYQDRATSEQKTDVDGPLTKEKLGVIHGVYFPMIQSILGMLIFVRIPQFIGECGVFQFILIFTLSSVTNFFTIISMSAIVTNGNFQRGGLYYVLSRSLGPGIGGSVGILQYIATAFACSFQVIGAAETFIIWADFHFFDQVWNLRICSFIALSTIFITTLYGTKWVVRLTNLLQIFVILGIISVLAGCFLIDNNTSDKITDVDGFSIENLKQNWNSSYQSKNNFILYISYIFPLTSGIFVGLNRSVDLKNPAKDIPRGSILGMLTAYFITLFIAIMYASVGPRFNLLNSQILFAAEIASPSANFIFLATIMIGLSNSLQNMSGDPKLLKVICEDGLLNKRFCDWVKQKDAYSLILYCLVSIFAMFYGSLEAIAPFITLFFLITCTIVNMSCFLLSYINSPNWRPNFYGYHISISFMGTICNIAFLMIIDYRMAILALIFQYFVYLYINKCAEKKNWGDQFQGIRKIQAVLSILKMSNSQNHVKNWNPDILTINITNPQQQDVYDDMITNEGCLSFMQQMKQGDGFNIYANILRSNFSIEGYDLLQKFEKKLVQIITSDYFNQVNEMKEDYQDIIVKCVNSVNVNHTINSLMQSSGLGSLKPNTLLVSWPGKWYKYSEDLTEFIDVIESGIKMENHIIVIKPQEQFIIQESKLGFIDMWSFVYEKGLIEMFGFILKKNSIWKNCKLRLFIAITQNDSIEQTKKEIMAFLDKYRIKKEIFTIQIIKISIQQKEVINHSKQFYQILNKVHRNSRKSILHSKLQLDSNSDEKLTTPEESTRRKKSIFLNHGGDQLYQENEKFDQKNNRKSVFVKRDSNEEEIQQLNQNNSSRRKNSVDMIIQSLQFDDNELLNHAKELNHKILDYSKKSQLVITNMPYVSGNETMFMKYVEAFTRNIKRVVLIHNAGMEVITQYA